LVFKAEIKMKKQTNLNWQNIAFGAVVVFVCLFGTNTFARAQEVKTDYKVGDRVECDPNWGKYYKGTVATVEREGWMYRIKFDYDGTNSTVNLELPCLVKQMRPLQAAEKTTNKEQNQIKPAPKETVLQKNDKKPKANEPEDFTYLADREPLDCPIEQTQVKNGAKPNAELLKKVIRCLYERRAPAGLDGAVTVDISAFQIGTARKWRPLDDIGNGNLSTIVYPIKVTWTEKTFYQTFTRVVDSISIFNCYVNAFGEWQCGLGQRIKESDVKRLPRPSKP
jgi:hypothetical protein